MPRNLEIKARVASLEAIRHSVMKLGAVSAGELKQIDTYFFVREGRLKMREINGADVELIAYRRGEDASRRESDFTVLSVPSPEPLKTMLASALGVRGIVAKHRFLYLYRSTRIHADEVEGLGTFLEFETAIGGSRDEADEELGALVRLFGIDESDVVRSSYIDLMEREGVLIKQRNSSGFQ